MGKYGCTSNFKERACALFQVDPMPQRQVVNHLQWWARYMSFFSLVKLVWMCLLIRLVNTRGRVARWIRKIRQELDA